MKGASASKALLSIILTMTSAVKNDSTFPKSLSGIYEMATFSLRNSYTTQNEPELRTSFSFDNHALNQIENTSMQMEVTLGQADSFVQWKESKLKTFPIDIPAEEQTNFLNGNLNQTDNNDHHNNSKDQSNFPNGNFTFNQTGNTSHQDHSQDQTNFSKNNHTYLNDSGIWNVTQTDICISFLTVMPIIELRLSVEPVTYVTSIFSYITCGISVFGIVCNVLLLVMLLKHKIKSLSILLPCLLIFNILLFVFLIFFSSLSLFGIRVHFFPLFVQWSSGLRNGAMAMIGIERSLIILKPLWYKISWRKKYTLISIGIIVLVNTIPTPATNLFRACGVKLPFHFPLVNFTLQQFIPFTIVIITSVAMAVGLIKRNKICKELLAGETRRNVKMTKTALVLIVTYAINLVPTLYALFMPYFMCMETSMRGFLIIIIIFLELLNACFNPIMYILSNRSSYEQFLQALGNCCSQPGIKVKNDLLRNLTGKEKW